MSEVMVICIVDDDSIYQYAMRKDLQSLEMEKELLFFNDGEEAMNFMTANLIDTKSLPDIIFLDINMPIMDGFQFMEHFVQLKPRLGKKITVYMVSSSIDPEDIKRAEAISEISDYLIKPVNLGELRELVIKLKQSGNS
ncbi:response regulator [Flagellimonas pelagia]|uniref:Response regulator n=1 Tax=Flagellimonas pelagia TaxID=2306998 RepID=A0A3A1NP10_9FLAO|nr:response regulator [Allomuricauda maritima]RIV45988.1 response regulator [Allomuricauda maritima]TXJ98754.1 response regulator [Allomuricauda maritima]